MKFVSWKLFIAQIFGFILGFVIGSLLIQFIVNISQL